MFRHRNILEILESKDFSISVEMFPPKNGISPDVVFRKISYLRYLDVDFMGITKGAMGAMRGGTVPIGFMTADRFSVEPLVHFRCRDHTIRSVENHLVDHNYFDITNVMAILGDVNSDGSNTELDPTTHHRYAYQLVEQIRDMNRGHYLPLPGSHTPRKGIATDFCIGVAAYPEAGDLSHEVDTVMRSKVEAGAHFAITQMFFDASSYFNYIDAIRDAGLNIPVIPGIRPLSTRRHIEVARDVFKANIPKEFLKRVEHCPDDMVKECSEEFTLELVRQLREGGAPGVHLFVLNDVKLAGDIIPKIRHK